MSDTIHQILQDSSPAAVGYPLTDEGALKLGRALTFPRGRTWVRSMMNQSADGSATGADGTSGSLGNPTDSFVLTVLRALPDVVLVGAETVRREGYRRPSGRACVREAGLRPTGNDYPTLAVLTRSGDVGTDLDPSWPTLLITSPGRAREVAERSGFPPENMVEADGPLAIRDALARRGLHAIQLEGGPRVLGDFLAHDAVDETVWTISARTVGGGGPRIVAGPQHDHTWELKDVFAGEHALVVRSVKG